jgi:DNA-binding CsgD family transcriptional regulator
MGFNVAGHDVPVGLHVYHDQERGPASLGDERGLALFQVLLPAFKAGAHAWLTLARSRESLLRVLDEITEGVAIFDATGTTLLHRSGALGRLLAAEPERTRLETALSRIAGSVGALRNRRGASERREFVAATASAVELRTTVAAYRMRASLLEAALLGPAAAVAVLVERVTATTLSPAAICRRYGLTPREFDVAQLMARGLPNKELARVLKISPHTARRHTEQVLRKLGLHTRSAVASALVGID